MRLFSDYRLGVLGEEEVVRGKFRPDLDPDSPEVLRALEEWDGSVYLHQDGSGTEAVLIRSLGPPKAPRWWIHALLLGLTLFTTLMAGALLRGVDPVGTEVLEIGAAWFPFPTTVDLDALLLGGPFAFSLVGILLLHELGHYGAARLRRVQVTPPFFIPFPAYYSVIGTLGAFIRIQGPVVRRSVLFDIGVAGPLASFFASLPAVVLGLHLSRPVAPGAEGPLPFVIQFAGEPIWIGGGLLFHGASILVGAGGEGPLLLHPLAFAGWVGLFVTALNLLPFGQLDGGHILYAMGRGIQRWVGRLFVLLLLLLGFLWWGWWIWCAAAVILSRGRISHPPVLQEEPSPGRSRIQVGWIAVLIFILTFMPVPVTL